MKTKTKQRIAIAAAVLTVILVILIKTVDVAPIGPNGTSIGLSHLNQAIHDAIGINQDIYTITEIGGILAIGVVAAFAIMGLVQWIQRKKLMKVDRELLVLGGLYVILGFLYVFFNKVAINYRPVIMPGEVLPESSFPSSHSMLGCTVMGSAYLLVDRYVKNPTAVKVLHVLCIINMIVIVGGRFLSGVHWFTDILGGILISIALIAEFSAVLDQIQAKK
ncbi:MAG: phosphatase PAP2 family protein [Solobacterium sp.]|nr:phosphatase PAP2 family protein [Solobacterium sp.]